MNGKSLFENVALPVRSTLWLLLAPQGNLFTHHVSQIVYLLIAISSRIGRTFGFVMMNSQRMEDDSRKSRAGLSESNNDLAEALTSAPTLKRNSATAFARIVQRNSTLN